MCTDCGCGSDEITIDGHHHHTHEHPHDHEHHHHEHHHEHGEHSHHQHAHDPHLSDSRKLRIEVDILAKNNEYAARNRGYFAERGILALNLVSSPGSGKTTLLTRTLTELKDSHDMAVIEGDQQTANDAERIRATGSKAVQINTGKGCHLDAHMVGHAMEHLAPAEGSLLFIENVGNLVCPAEFDLGEAHKVAILSVTEGEDKPIKYPDMFHAADVMILNKVDLLPYVNFDVEQCVEYARRVNPDIEIIQLSATAGEGMADWYAWLESQRGGLQSAQEA